MARDAINHGLLLFTVHLSLKMNQAAKYARKSGVVRTRVDKKREGGDIRVRPSEMSANRALSLKYAVESSGLYQSFLRILNRKLSITQRILPVVSVAGH